MGWNRYNLCVTSPHFNDAALDKARTLAEQTAAQGTHVRFGHTLEPSRALSR